MDEEVLLEMFDDELEVMTDQVTSSRVLIQKAVEDDSKLEFSNDEVSIVANYIAKSLDSNTAKSFYIHLHDNVIKELAYLEDYSSTQRFLDKSIQNFTENPAKEGGCSVLGIVDVESRQLLTAFFEPYCEVRISSFELAK